MLRFKRVALVLALVLSLVMLLGLTVEAKTKLRFTLVCGVEETPGWKEMVDRFNAQSPDIDLEFERLPGGWTEYTQKMQAQVAAGAPPDVGRMSPSYTPAFEKVGSLIDLYPFIKEENFDLTQFYETALNVFLKGESMPAFPAGIYTTATFYNKTMFDEAGIDRPSDDWTQQDLLAISQKLTKGEGPAKQFGIYIFFDPELCLQYFWENGVDLMNPEMTKCTFDEPESVETLQFLQDLIWKYKVAPTPADYQTMGLVEMFMTGRLGMYQLGQWMIPAMRQIEDFEWGVLPYPLGKTGKHISTIWADPYVIYTGSKYPKEAWEVIKFFVSPEGDSALVEHGLMGTPINKTVAQEKADILYQPLTGPDKQVWWDTLEYARAVHIPSNWQEIKDKTIEILDLVALNEVSAEEAASMVCEEVNRLLKEK